MGSEQFIESFVKDWFCDLPSALHPDRFDAGEPVRKRFDKEGLEGAIALWKKIVLPLMLKRVKKPKFHTTGSWRTRRGLDTRPFPWDYIIWLNEDAEDDLALELLHFLIKHLKPAFGSITTYDDQKQKHFITYKDRGGVAQKYIGLDVGETLPGVYWATYFGRWCLEKIGREKFIGLPAYKTSNDQDGVLVLAYEKCASAGSPEALQVEEGIRQQLGKEHFFIKQQGSGGE